mmetsp:Transcript_28711/g.96339  ORF Transcript_28711/g.96339 Transcript_28711/m.96339 type:complete len:326 (-) Transcript_28711:301-1278(-)
MYVNRRQQVERVESEARVEARAVGRRGLGGRGTDLEAGNLSRHLRLFLAVVEDEGAAIVNPFFRSCQASPCALVAMRVCRPEARKLVPEVAAEEAEEGGQRDGPCGEHNEPPKAQPEEALALALGRLGLELGRRRRRRRQVGRLPRSRRRPRREGRRRRRRRSPRAVDPRISRRDPERGQEASVCIAVGAAAAVPVAGFSHRGVWPARIPRCPNLGDVAAVGEHEAVATLAPRVASLTYGRWWGGWRSGRGRRRRIAWRRRRRWPDAAKVEALSPVVGCVPARPRLTARAGILRSPRAVASRRRRERRQGWRRGGRRRGQRRDRR